MKRLFLALMGTALLLASGILGLCAVFPEAREALLDVLEDVEVLQPFVEGWRVEGDVEDVEDDFEQTPIGTQDDKALYEVLQEAIDGRKTKVSIGHLGYTEQALREALSNFFFTKPELFYVDNSYHYYLKSNSDEIATVELSYLYSVQETKTALTLYRNTVEGIVAGIPAGASDFDKILYLHDYMVRNYAYDYEQAQGDPIRDAYRFFESGRGVCQAYMLALIALCEEADLLCLPVTSQELEHAWNLVQLDGAWYHIDVTWDDAGGEESAVYPSFVSYRYFLLSDQALRETGRRVQWQAAQRAKGTLYDDAIWHGATTPMLKCGEVYYCALFDSASQKTKLYHGNATQMSAVLTLEDAVWYGDANKFYCASWVGLAYWQGKILLSTDSAFFWYDPSNGSLQKVRGYSFVSGTKQIFGICDVSDTGEVSYVVAKDYTGDFEIRTWRIS